MHVAHITSNGLRATPRLLQMIAEARARQLDITTELYPYTAAMSAIESALFDPGWQSTLGIGYHELQWTETGERLTAESFARYRQTGGGVILHMIPPSALDAAIVSPFVMIASDGGLRNGKGHPRSSGTFARVLGHYVRETGTMSLMEAIRKMSLMPAQRLQQRVPAMRNKGRIREGADADLTSLRSRDGEGRIHLRRAGAVFDRHPLCAGEWRRRGERRQAAGSDAGPSRARTAAVG